MMKAVETYLRDLYHIYQSGTAGDETAYHLPLNVLLNEIGQTLKPKVRCVLSLKNIETGAPVGGLFTGAQFSKTAPLPDAGDGDPPTPARGAVEIKRPADDLPQAAYGLRLVKHLQAYGQILVTNYRAFVLMGLTAEGQPTVLESYTLAGAEAEFWTQAANPRIAAKIHGRRLADYLQRVACYPTRPAAPAETARLLAGYARESLARIEDALAFVGTGQEPLRQTLDNIRITWESTLALAFEGEKGDRFFRASLVQTLFYAIFSAWLLWHTENPARQDRFAWRMTPWYLRLPWLQALFEQLAPPENARPGGLEEILDWAGRALHRVNRLEFFNRFDADQAIPQFFEPFLHAFSPQLEKSLGVWYTPPEVAAYMAARIDTLLRDVVDLADGLADEQVYLLDPCCGTGTYLVEALRRIAVSTPDDETDGERRRRRLKRAATQRLIGFEILPASALIAHLRLNLLLRRLEIPLADSERAEVYLTNALTGWTPPQAPVKPSDLALLEFQSERDAANALKRGRKIMVMLGSPPHNDFAGMTMAQEQSLRKAYRPAQNLPPLRGLDDLYVRFFRLAERRIVEQTGRGIICYLAPYAWLDGVAFKTMREQYVSAFDQLWVDCLNGDKYRTGKLTPDGAPDPSIFAAVSKRLDSPAGMAVTTLVRRTGRQPARQIYFRDLWGAEKARQLLETAPQTDESKYEALPLRPKLKLPFMPAKIAADYFSWPLLPKLFPISFRGVKTNRDPVVIDIDQEQLRRRMEKYFDPAVSHDQMRLIAPKAVETTRRFDGVAARDHLRERGFLPDRIVRYCYRPFDIRWLYWEPDENFIAQDRPDYGRQIFDNSNIWLEARPRQRAAQFDRGYVTNVPGDNFGNGVSHFFPLYLIPTDTQLSLFKQEVEALQPNLSSKAAVYLETMDATPPHLFYHTVTILHTPAYRRENAGALRQNWPRIPLPNREQVLRRSAVLGRTIAMLLNPDIPVSETTTGPIRPDLKVMGVLKREDGERVDPAHDLALTMGWGYMGRNGTALPGPGQAVERAYTPEERSAIEKGAARLGLSLDQLDQYLGLTTYDVYLNDAACWSNIPLKVWEYTIDGYQVIKKWLSYREAVVLERPLTLAEAQEVTRIVRRIATIRLMTPALDANYRAVKQAAYPWPNRSGAG